MSSRTALAIPSARALRDCLPEIALLLVTTAAGLWAGGRWLDPFDDPAFPWSVVHRLSNGEKLYRDVYVQYTPLSFYLLTGGARLFGASARYFLIANWLPAILAALLLLRCGRAFLTNFERCALAALVLASSLLVPGAGHIVLPYNPGVVHALALSLGALLLVRPDADRLPTRPLLAGGLAGLAFCCKQEVGAAALLALAVAAIAGHARPRAWTIGVLAGFLAVLLPVGAFILTQAPLESLRRDNFLWPLAKAPDTMKFLILRTMGLKEPRWAASVVAVVMRDLGGLGLLAAAAMLLARERSRTLWLRAGALLGCLVVWFLLHRLAPAPPLPSLSLSTSVAVAAAVLSFRLVDPSRRPFAVAFAVFAALASARAAFSPRLGGHYAGPAHFACALTSLLFLAVLLPPLLLGSGRPALYFRRLAVAAVLAVSSWRTAKAIEQLRMPSHEAVETRAGRVFTSHHKAEMLRALARHARPNEPVLALPENNGVDVLFQLRSLSPLTNSVPGFLTEDIERQVIQREAEFSSALVVVFHRTFPEFGHQPFGVGYGKELADWLSRKYEVVESLPAGRIMRRRADTDAFSSPR